MAPKRRKIDLFTTRRARNGGADDSFLDPASNPNLNMPSGSDTESESDQEATAQKYLNMKRESDADRPVETVFGPDVNLWHSMGGKLYAEPVSVEGPKRKRGDLRLEDVEAKTGREQDQDTVRGHENETPVERDLYPSLPPSLFIPLFPPPPPTITFPYPLPPAIPSSPPISDLLPSFLYPARNPTATKFHLSSAAIDPRGACNRSIRPLPRRPASRIISGSFESIRQDLKGGDRFDERGYQLGQAKIAGGLRETERKGGEVVEEKGGKKENTARRWLRDWLRL